MDSTASRNEKCGMTIDCITATPQKNAHYRSKLMPEQFTGLVEIQNDDGETGVTIDGNAADVLIGDENISGFLSIRNAVPDDAIRLTPNGVYLFNDNNEQSARMISSAGFGSGQVNLYDGFDNAPTVSIDGLGASIRLGGAGRSGDAILEDGEGNFSIALFGSSALIRAGTEDNAGAIRVEDGNGRSAFELNGENAALRIGSDGLEGDIIVRDVLGRDVFTFDGSSAALYIGFAGNEGDIRVRDSAGRDVFNFNGNDAALYLGQTGNEGFVRVRDIQGRDVFRVNGNSAAVHIGATGNEGDLLVYDSAGRDVFNFNGSNALLDLGANGSDGDLWLRNNSGDVTIQLDGASGQVITDGADCAENFAVQPDIDLHSGMVMVLAEDGRLRPSTHAYDKKVVGVISGAGDYQPGIILDGRKDAKDHQPIALNGKVYCQVDATTSAVAMGDLLTTSNTPGHAMKADDPLSAFGSVIGKALGNLDSGCGLVPVLISLQ